MRNVCGNAFLTVSSLQRLVKAGSKPEIESSIENVTSTEGF